MTDITMNHAPQHIVFAGGGTGGHLFPGLAVAQRLAAESPQIQITFVGSGKPFEERLIQQAGFVYRTIPCHPLPRKPRKLLTFLAANLAGYRAARRILRSTPVHAVVGLGGYASAPMARAAIGSEIPLLLLEQNAIPGRATRWLATSAHAVCTALPQTAARLPAACRVRLTGTPIRPIQPHAGGPSDEKKRLLILGGSGGAHALNQNIPLALGRIRSRLAGWQILHQSGAHERDATAALYRELGLDAAVVGFLDDLPQTLAGADLAICRAGGSTLAELAAAGVPAVLLPYPHAADDHQRANADCYSAAGGCLTLDERRLDGPLDLGLAEKLLDLLADSALRARMAAAMRSLARPHAAAEVAKLVRTVLDAGGLRQEKPAAA